IRTVRGAAGDHEHRRCRRPHRGQLQPLRRHPEPVQRDPAQARHRDHPSRSDTSTKVVSMPSLRRVTLNRFWVTLRKLGIETTFVDVSDLDEWKSAVQDNTKLFFAE